MGHRHFRTSPPSVRVVTLSAVVALAAVALALIAGNSASAISPSDAAKAKFKVLKKADASGLLVLNEQEAQDAAKERRGPIWLKQAGDDVDIASAREAKLPKKGARVWAVTDTDGVCVLAMPEGSPAQGPASVCGDQSTLEQGVYMTIGQLGASPTFIAGLVPDGAEQVTLTLIDGRQEQATVTENAFFLDAPVPIQEVTFNDGSGPRTVPVEAPRA